MAGSSVLRAVPASDRQQRAEPLLGKGGRAKHRLWHRCRPAARYTQVLRAARSPQGSMAWPAGQDASMRGSCPSSSPGTRRHIGARDPHTAQVWVRWM